MKGLIIYDMEQRQCEYIAQKLAASTRVAYVNVENTPSLHETEALILVKKGRYNNETSAALLHLVANAEMPSVKMALVVHCRSTLTGRYHKFYYNGNNGSYINQFNPSNTVSNGSRLHQILRMKGIGTIDDCVCFYSPFLLGHVTTDSMMRTIRFVRGALGLGRYE